MHNISQQRLVTIITLVIFRMAISPFVKKVGFVTQQYFFIYFFNPRDTHFIEKILYGVVWDLQIILCSV